MLLKNEYVRSICEFAQQKLLVYSDDCKCFLIIHDWKVVHEIADSEAGNTSKVWQSPMPGFNVDYFPFLVSSGLEFYSLVNVTTGTLQRFINASVKNARAM